jgi:TRAP-type C4-dicarboxylate transport system substrate-binding protein
MKRLLVLAMVVFFLTGLFPGICATPLIKEAQAQSYLFKFAHAQPPTHPRHKSMEFFKEKLESASKGRIKVELYAGGVLGKEPELMDMVKVGTIQGTRGALFERANKKFLLYTLPFFFSDIEQAKKLIRSSYGEKLNQGARANGFYIPATGVAGGFRQFTNNVKPIVIPDDMTGLKENPCSNIVEMKFFEVQKYFTEVNYQIHPDPFFVSLAWYESLPADLMAIFADTAKAAIIHSDTIWLASEVDYFKFLSQKMQGNSISAKDHTLFVEKVKPVWQHYVKEGYFSQAEIDEALAIARK